MEIPTSLKKLYRHWKYHTIATINPIPKDTIYINISEFVKERISIWKKKTLKENPTYTKDPILGTYRFCNIFREFDKQTIEFHTILNPIRDDFPLWLLNMFYFRMVARIETVKELGLLSFDKKENEKFYKKFTALKRPKFGTPYVFPISTIMRSKTPTRELFITEYLPSIMKDIAKEISTWKKVSVYDGVSIILPKFKYNLHFLWTEVLIDVAYQYPEYLDLYKRFPIGPGSKPTMMSIDSKKDPTELVVELSKIGFDIGLTFENKPIRLSAENWEGIGCEFRKYTNLKAGRGRRRLYK